MRIVFNLLTTLKPKSGVGQYAARLFAALAEQLPAGDLQAFPTGKLAEAVRRMQQARAGGQAGAAAGRIPTLAKRAARSVVDAGLGFAFRSLCRRSGRRPPGT